MNAYEIPISINFDGLVRIPQDIINILPREKTLKAIIMIPDYNEQESDEWKNLAANEFLMGYNEKDSIYDKI
jgi:hypothetical protein